MNSDIDLPSIAIDLSSSSTAELQPTSNLIQVHATDFSHYLRTFAGINSPSIQCTVIIIAFDLIFTLITLVIGGTNMSSCPVERRIPIYLVVLGTINLVSIFFSIVAYFLHIKQKDYNVIGFVYVTFSAVVIIIFQLFNFIWLIFGTVWSFSVLNQVQYEQMNEKTYCHEHVYRYTLVSITLQYIIPIVICCCKNIPLMK